MTLEQVFFLSQSIAAVGVMASLVFVGLEVRNNVKAVRSATAQSVHESYARWYASLFVTTSVLETANKGFADIDSLTPVERAQFFCMLMSVHSIAQNAFHQWRQRHLADELWTAWEGLMMIAVHTPGGQAFWRQRSWVFDRGYQDEVAAMIARTPNPLGRAFGVVPVTYGESPVAPAT